MELQVAINTSHVGKHPAGMTKAASEAWFRQFNGRFTNRVVTLDDLAGAIQAGHAIAPCHKEYRKAANFICAQHDGIDLDDGSMTLDQVLKMPVVSRYAALAHTTASHTAASPRLRVLFVLDRPIGNPEKYVLLVKSLLHYFGTADPMCSDAARLFYGAPGCELVKLGNVLTLEDAAALFVNPYLAMLDQQATDRAEALQHRQIAERGDVSAAVLERHSEKLLRRVQDAPNGEKYYRLRDISRTFGGYVAGGYYSEGEVCNWLRDAIESRRADVENLNHAYRTIDQWVKLGMNDPLYFELRPQSPNGRPGGLPRSMVWREQAIQERLEEVLTLIGALPVVDGGLSSEFGALMKEQHQLSYELWLIQKAKAPAVS